MLRWQAVPGFVTEQKAIALALVTFLRCEMVLAVSTYCIAATKAYREMTCLRQRHLSAAKVTTSQHYAIDTSLYALLHGERFFNTRPGTDNQQTCATPHAQVKPAVSACSCFPRKDKPLLLQNIRVGYTVLRHVWLDASCCVRRPAEKIGLT